MPIPAPRDTQPGAQPAAEAPLYERIYQVVAQVPPGEVATYGQVAFVAEAPSPRIVGYAMAAVAAGSGVPWHRVINHQGRVSPRREGGADTEQRRLLEGEGVLFDERGRVDFARVGWRGPGWAWLEANGFDVGELIARSQRLRRTGPWRRWSL